MSLPKINSDRLQQVVFDLETRKGAYRDFDGLRYAIVQTNWAQEEELDADTVGKLIIAHDIITKTPKPEVAEAAEPPQQADPVVVTTPVAEQPKGVKVYTEGGKGRKQCPTCNKYVPAVSKTCVCGHVFVRKTAEPAAAPAQKLSTSSEKAKSPAKTLPRFGGMRRSVLIPRGVCPHRLSSTDPQEVEDWGYKVVAAFEDEGATLTLTGLLFFVQQFYGMRQPEYDQVRVVLEGVFGR